MTIRPATLADIPAITRIYGHAVTHGTASFELEAPDEAEMTRRMTAILDGGFPYLIAEADGRLAGYAYANLFRTRPAYRFTLEDSVYIAPEAQGRGVGRLLMERLIETVRAMGFRQFVAVIGDGHATSASVKLHERLGFSHSGRLVGSGYKHGRWLDTVFMQLALNGGTSTPPDPDSVPERRFRAEGVRP